MGRTLKRAIVCALGFTIWLAPLAFWHCQANPSAPLPENLVRTSDTFDADRALADLIALEANLSLKSRPAGPNRQICLDGASFLRLLANGEAVGEFLDNLIQGDFPTPIVTQPRRLEMPTVWPRSFSD